MRVQDRKPASSPRDSKEFYELYRHWLSLLRPLASAEAWGPDPSPRDAENCVHRGFDLSRGCDTVCVGGGDAVMDFLPDGRLVFFGNSRLITPGASFHPLGLIPVPELTPEAAERRGLSLFRQLTGRNPEDLSLASPTVEFERDSLRWRVSWRQTLHGFRYRDNDWTLSFHPAGGLAHFRYDLTSETCPTEVKLSEERAREIGLSAAPAAIKKFRGRFPSDTIRGVGRVRRLLIVRPNFIFTPPPSSVDGPEAKPKLRLAYDVYIDVEFREDCLYFWVDAATGEILGGGVPA